jgi:hypothetical protein
MLLLVNGFANIELKEMGLLAYEIDKIRNAF